MRRRRKIKAGAARFFVGMKELTNLATDELRLHLGRWAEMELPSKATLNSICRNYGLPTDPPALRLMRDCPLGELRM